MIFQDKRKNEIFVDLIERVTGVINADVSVLCTRGFFYLKKKGGGVQIRKVTLKVTLINPRLFIVTYIHHNANPMLE